MEDIVAGEILMSVRTMMAWDEGGYSEMTIHRDGRAGYIVQLRHPPRPSRRTPTRVGKPDRHPGRPSSLPACRLTRSPARQPARAQRSFTGSDQVALASRVSESAYIDDG